MLLLYAGLAPLVVWHVFKSPAIDYRLVVAGALLPLADAVTGGPWMLHTLLVSVAGLTAVMLATRRRRLARRRLLGLPIGMFVHLALDSAWSRAEVFWWPFLGRAHGGIGEGRLPEFDHGAAVVLLEAIGGLCLFLCWREFGLDDGERRHRLLHTGQLDRSFVGGTG